MSKQYFVGIELEEKDDRLFSLVKRQFNAKGNLISPAHISLTPSFEFFDEKELIERLKNWASKENGFEVKFEKVGRFVQPKYGTVFMYPEKTEIIKKLQNSLINNLKEIEQIGEFVPHLTLAQRVDLDKVDKIKNEIEMMGLKLNLKVNKIVLYKKEKSWEKFEEFFLL